MKEPKADLVEELAAALEDTKHIGHLGHIDYFADLSFAKMMERGLPKSFSMYDYYQVYSTDGFLSEKDYEQCDTVGCVAGFCFSLWPPEIDELAGDFIAHLRRTLNISHDLACDLCVPSFIQHFGQIIPYGSVTAKQAAQAVRNILDPEVLSGQKFTWHHMEETLDGGGGARWQPQSVT